MNVSSKSIPAPRRDKRPGRRRKKRARLYQQRVLACRASHHRDASLEQYGEARASSLMKRQIFVRNLDFSASATDVSMALSSAFGEVEFCELYPQRGWRGFGVKHQGRGVVQFRDEAGGQAALASGQVPIRGRAAYLSPSRRLVTRLGQETGLRGTVKGGRLEVGSWEEEAEDETMHIGEDGHSSRIAPPRPCAISWVADTPVTVAFDPSRRSLQLRLSLERLPAPSARPGAIEQGTDPAASETAIENPSCTASPSLSPDASSASPRASGCATRLSIESAAASPASTADSSTKGSGGSTAPSPRQLGLDPLDFSLGLDPSIMASIAAAFASLDFSDKAKGHCSDNSSGTRHYELEFPLSSLEHWLHLQGSEPSGGPSARSASTSCRLVLFARRPPLVWRRNNARSRHKVSQGKASFLSWQAAGLEQTHEEEEEGWVRSVDFTPHGSLGSSTVYAITFQDRKDVQPLVDALKRFKRLYPANRPQDAIAFHERVQAQEMGGPAAALTVSSDAASEATAAISEADQEVRRLAYEVRFQLECLASDGVVSRCQAAHPEVTRLLLAMGEETAVEVLQRIKALAVTLRSLTEELRYWSEEAGLEGQGKAEQRRGQGREDRDREEDGRLVWVHHARLTPTRVLAFGPRREVANRVLRAFVGREDCFLRVCFTDEDGRGLVQAMHERGGDIADLLERVKSACAQGLWLAGRRFVFLGSSGSQLREGSCWFVDLSGLGMGLQTAMQLRRRFGDFERLTSVSKFFARLGQCFSATVTGPQLCTSASPTARFTGVGDWSYAEVADVERNGYCFTDGVGVVSRHLAEQIAAALGLREGVVPSAFQIRFAGYKGVLSTWTADLPLLEAHGLREPSSVTPHRLPVHMLLRPSMRKFELQTPDARCFVEVCTYSCPRPAFLNRQIILLLNSLGVPDSVFIEMQESMLALVTRAHTDRDVALSLLRTYTNDSPADALPINSTSVLSAAQGLLEVGANLLTEPLLQLVLPALRSHTLRSLRSRARVLVEKAALLLGVADETGTLSEGEVFVRASGVVIEEPVVVAKNPCLHIGDVRVLTAVRGGSQQLLECMHDVLVFPTQGRRPHADECSGSDLDGDMYFVSWDPRLLPPPDKRNQPPLEYKTPAAAVEKGGVVQEGELIDFLVGLLTNTDLGTISNAHLAQADASPDGAFDAKCLQLAELHARAVDFQKTGEAVQMPKELRPQKYPDFMEKPAGLCESYESTKVLGIMFRRVKGVMQGDEGDRGLELRYDVGLQVHGWEEYAEEAEAALEDYRLDLSRLMERHGVEEEGMAVCGFLPERTRLYRGGGRRRGEGSGDLKRELSVLVHKHRRRFWQAVIEEVFGQEVWEEEAEDPEEAELNDEFASCRSLAAFEALVRGRVESEATGHEAALGRVWRRASAWYLVPFHVIIAEELKLPRRPRGEEEEEVELEGLARDGQPPVGESGWGAWGARKEGGYSMQDLPSGLSFAWMVADVLRSIKVSLPYARSGKNLVGGGGAVVK